MSFGYLITFLAQKLAKFTKVEVRHEKCTGRCSVHSTDYFWPHPLRATSEPSLRSWFFAKNTFSFFIETLDLTRKNHQTSTPDWKTPKSWPRNKNLWLSDEYSPKDFGLFQNITKMCITFRKQMMLYFYNLLVDKGAIFKVKSVFISQLVVIITKAGIFS